MLELKKPLASVEMLASKVPFTKKTATQLLGTAIPAIVPTTGVKVEDVGDWLVDVTVIEEVTSVVDVSDVVMVLTAGGISNVADPRVSVVKGKLSAGAKEPAW